MTAEDARRLARLLSLVAADLEKRGYPSVGVIRQGCRALLEMAFRMPADEVRTCPGCGGLLPPHLGPGPAPRFCAEACRSRWRRRRDRGSTGDAMLG